MQFEKALRRRQVSERSQGHTEAECSIQQGDPLLDTAHRKGHLEIDSVDISWPAEVLVNLQWIAAPMSAQGPMVQSIVPDFSFAPCALYAESSVDPPEFSMHLCSAIEIQLAAELEMPNLHLMHAVGDLLYTHRFITQSHDQPLTQYRRPVSQSDWLVTPAKRPHWANVNLLGLLGYAGWAKPGTRLQDIEQLFSYIGQAGDDTRISLRSYSQVLSQKVPPPQGGSMGKAQVVYLDDIPLKQCWSVAQVIAAHKVHIVLGQSDQRQTYHSTRIVEELPAQNQFSVEFRLKP